MNYKIDRAVFPRNANPQSACSGSLAEVWSNLLPQLRQMARDGNPAVIEVLARYQRGKRHD